MGQEKNGEGSSSKDDDDDDMLLLMTILHYMLGLHHIIILENGSWSFSLQKSESIGNCEGRKKNFLFLHRLFFCVKKKMEEDTTHNQKRRDGLDGMGAKLLVRGSHHLPQFCSLISPSHFRLLHHNSNVLQSGKEREILYGCIDAFFPFSWETKHCHSQKKTFEEIIICIAFQ